MTFKRCRYSNCRKLSKNGCCCVEHEKLAKQEYNDIYYSKKKEIILTERYSSMLRTCIKQFGINVAFEAEFLEHMKFDWKFSLTKIMIDACEYTIIGDYGYVVFKNQKIKIVRI